MSEEKEIRLRGWSLAERAIIESKEGSRQDNFSEMEADHHMRLMEALSGNLQVLCNLRDKYKHLEIHEETAREIIPENFEEWRMKRLQDKQRKEEEYERTRKQLNSAIREGMLPRPLTAEKRSVAPVTLLLHYDMKRAPNWVNVEKQTLRGDSFRNKGQLIVVNDPVQMIYNLSGVITQRQKFISSAFMYYNLRTGNDSNLYGYKNGIQLYDRRGQFINEIRGMA